MNKQSGGRDTKRASKIEEMNMSSGPIRKMDCFSIDY